MEEVQGITRNGTSVGSWVDIREDFLEEVMFRLKPDK